jgi:hypothetical protein
MRGLHYYFQILSQIRFRTRHDEIRRENERRE